MKALRSTISSLVKDEDFSHHPYPVRFMNKEHLYYYRVYKEVVGEIPRPGPSEKVCPNCRAGMHEDGFHCRICGSIIEERL